MKKFLTILLLSILSFPAIVQAEPVEYKIDEVSRKLYPRPEWYIKLTTADNHWTFCYDILTDEIVPGKVYTIDDMLKADCQAYDNEERESHKFAEATYCETYAENGDLLIAATATTVDGMEISLHYGIEALPIATDTLEVVTSDVELQDLTARGAAIFVGTTEELAMSIGIKGKQIAGEYTWDNLYESFCYVELPSGEVVYILDGHATITAIERGYTAEGYFLGEDAHCYHAVFTYQIPEPQETRVLRCDNLVVNTSYVAQFGEIIYEASNEDWEIELWVNADKPLGFFEGNVVDAGYSVLTNRHTKEMFDLYYATFTVGTDESNVYLKGGMLARDSNYYVLDLYSPLTTDTRTVELNIQDAKFFDNTKNGVLQFYGTSEDGNQYVSIALKTYDITTSTFDRSQTYRDYTYIEEKAPVHIYYEPYIATFNLIPQADGSIDIEAFMRCDNLVNEEDHPLYIVRMHCTADDVQLGMKFDAQNQDFEGHISSEQLVLDDATLEDGFVFLDGYDPVSRCSVSLEFNISSLDPQIGIPAGVYPINETFAEGTVGASHGVQGSSVTPSYAAYGDAEGNLDVPVWYILQGTVTVQNNNGQFFAEVEALNSCNRRIHITLGDFPEGIRRTMENGQRTTDNGQQTTYKILRNNQLLIKRGPRTYDAQGRTLIGE